MFTKMKVIKLLFMLILFLFGNVGNVLAQNKIPQFKDYPVTETYTGKTAPLDLTKKDRTNLRLQKAAQQKPNFAGQYILTAWGCGTECVTGAIIDAKTGKLYWFPFIICCWGGGVDETFNPIDYRLDSKLIVFSGERSERKGDNGAHYYKFEKGRFIHIQSVLKKEQN